MAKRLQAPLDTRGVQDVEIGGMNEGHEGSLIDPDSERSSKEKTKPQGLNIRVSPLTVRVWSLTSFTSLLAQCGYIPFRSILGGR